MVTSSLSLTLFLWLTADGTTTVKIQFDRFLFLSHKSTPRLEITSWMNGMNGKEMESRVCSLNINYCQLALNTIIVFHDKKSATIAAVAVEQLSKKQRVMASPKINLSISSLSSFAIQENLTFGCSLCDQNHLQ